LPDQKFSRRGWVTYRRDVNIKEIFWSLKSVRVSIDQRRKVGFGLGEGKSQKLSLSPLCFSKNFGKNIMGGPRQFFLIFSKIILFIMFFSADYAKNQDKKSAP
jgi:hypothetical protein